MQERDLFQLSVVNAEGAVIGLETMQGQVLKRTERVKIGFGTHGGPRAFYPGELDD